MLRCIGFNKTFCCKDRDYKVSSSYCHDCWWHWKRACYAQELKRMLVRSFGMRGEDKED